MKLSTRLAIAMVALVLFAAAVFAAITYRTTEAALVPAALERIEAQVRLLAAELRGNFLGARDDILSFAAARAVEDVMRARSNGGVHPLDGTTEASWRRRVAGRYVTELTSKSIYGQLRLIGVEDGGRELVRVDRSGPGGAIRIVPDDELQRKGDRPYFAEASRLSERQIYVSGVELNQERGRIEVPHEPVLRIASPVYTNEGKLFAIVVLNIDLRPVFARLRTAAKTGGQIYVVNERGDFLVHPDEGREFAFEFGRQSRIQDEFPDLAAVLGADQSWAHLIDDAAGERLGAGAAPLRLADGPWIAVIETAPYAAIMAPADGLRQSMLLAVLIAVIGAIVGAVLLARSLTQPLVRMTEAVAAFGRNRQMIGAPKATGEVGVLARAFERMAGEIKSGSEKVKELARRERFYIAAVESSNDAFITIDPDGRITGWNPGAEHMFGYVTDEAIGQPISIIIPQDRRDEARVNRDKIHRLERIANLETVRIAKDSRRIDVVVDSCPIKSRSGQLLGSSIIARDVTAEKLAQEMFKLAVEACPTGMVMFDRNNRIVLVNTETERLFGYRRDELIGRPVEDLMPYGLSASEIEEPSDAATAPATNGHERDLLGVHSDGTRFPVEVRLNPIRIRDGLLVLGVIVDISERRRNERMKDEFVSTVSHELRTPLTSIAGSLGLLTGGAAGQMAEPTMRLLKIAHKNSERLVRLINDILDIEKIESGKVVFDLKRVDVPALMEQAIEANRGFAESFGVRVRLDAAPASVRADADRLVQVVTNLLSNAVKFSPRDDEVVVAIEQRADVVRIAVHDHGPGIPEDFRPRVFEKFAQADTTDARQKGGTGLGLSIVKQIVLLLGGEVWFECPPGGTTSFYVNLPRWGLGADAASSNSARTPHLLICDDDTSVAETIAGRLVGAGFSSDCTETARDALAKAQATAYDAILVDLKLPDRDGISLIQELRGQPRYQNTPIVVISADAARGRNDLRSSSLDVLDWLNKPIDVRRLADVLGRPLARGGAKRPCILHVDDDASVLAVVAESLSPSCDVVSVPSITAARTALVGHRFDFAVLDLLLSQASGLDLLPELRDGDGTALPVILYSARAANGKNAEQVQAALNKSHTSIDHLIATLRKHVTPGHLPAVETREVA